MYGYVCIAIFDSKIVSGKCQAASQVWMASNSSIWKLLQSLIEASLCTSR